MRNLNIRKHGENTSNVATSPSTASSNESYHARVAGLWCTVLCRCFI